MAKVYGFHESFERRERELADSAIDVYYNVHNNIENFTPETMKSMGIVFVDGERQWGANSNTKLLVSRRDKDIDGPIHIVVSEKATITCEYDTSLNGNAGGAGVTVLVDGEELNKALHSKGYDYCKEQIGNMGSIINKAIDMQQRGIALPSVRTLKSQFKNL